MPPELILFPFGGNSREALMVVLQTSAGQTQWTVIGIIDDDPGTWHRQCGGVNVLGGRDVLRRYPQARVLAVPGNPGSYLMRERMIRSLGLEKDRFATVVDPSARIAADVNIGYNTLIMPNVVIGAGGVIGNHCILLANTVVSHDSHVGDYTCVGSGVVIAGSVNIGASCYIGAGAKISAGSTIGDQAMIGLGAVVVSDVAAGVVTAGNPAKVLRRVC